MRERPKTLKEALQLACQYQGVEESQKRLHGVSAKVETMAVGKEDDSESESETVAAITIKMLQDQVVWQPKWNSSVSRQPRTIEERIRDHARTTL